MQVGQVVGVGDGGLFGLVDAFQLARVGVDVGQALAHAFGQLGARRDADVAGVLRVVVVKGVLKAKGVYRRRAPVLSKGLQLARCAGYEPADPAQCSDSYQKAFKNINRSR